MVDIMSDFGFGQKIDIMTTPELGFILDALGNYAWRMGIYKESPFLAKLQLEALLGCLGGNRQVKKWAQWGEKYNAAILDSSDKKEKGRFSLFLDSIDPITGNAPSRAELSAEGFFLMLAGLHLFWEEPKHRLTDILPGSDSTATTLSALFFYLVHYPEMYNKLASEIRATFYNVEEICSGSALSSCSYLGACITETLRLSPATVAAPWRDVGRGVVIVDGELIPENCEVGTFVSLPSPDTY